MMAAEGIAHSLSATVSGLIRLQHVGRSANGYTRRKETHSRGAFVSQMSICRGSRFPNSLSHLRSGGGARTRWAPVTSAALQSNPLVFELPVDHAQLLGLHGREPYLERHINTAYEELQGTQQEEGYSPRVESGRRTILDEARRALIEARGRVPRESPGLAIPYNIMPGVLSLLQEVGEYETVLDVGGKLLESREGRPFRRDILLSMALAQCGLASAAFDDQAVAAGCARMEKAAALLSDAGKPPLAPALAANMRAALGDFRPACVLDQLKLPLAAQYAPVRKLALTHLRSLLADPPSGGQTPVDEAYAVIALERLTAQETAYLVDWPAAAAGSAPWMTSGVLRRAVSALLAVGLIQRKPSLARDADELLQMLRKGNDVVAEMLAAKMLLGAPQGAERMLAEEERLRGRAFAPLQGLAASRQEVSSFVHENETAGGDQLPGQVLFTENWISQVALASFRDTSAEPPPVSLVDYFNDARVTGWLSMNGTGNGDSPIGSAVSRVGGWLNSVRGALKLDSAVAEVVGVKRVVIRQAITDTPKSLLNPAAAALQPGSSSSTSRHSNGASTSGSGLLSIPAPGQGRVGNLILGAALVCAVAAVTARNFSSGPQLVPPRGAMDLGTGTGTGTRPSGTGWWSALGGEAAQPISRAVAAAIIGDWQEAKAAAMGPRRNGTLLSEVLAEPLLSVIRDQASQAQAAGWFWVYNLKHIKIEAMHPAVSSASATGAPAVVVTARLQESADLWGENGKQADSYSSTYRVEYTMTGAPEGGWRISEAVVLGA